VYAPYSWSELMARSGTDAKVFALNAESEYFEMMAYLTHQGTVPDNVRSMTSHLAAMVAAGRYPGGRVCRR